MSDKLERTVYDCYIMPKRRTSWSSRAVDSVSWLLQIKRGRRVSLQLPHRESPKIFLILIRTASNFEIHQRSLLNQKLPFAPPGYIILWCCSSRENRKKDGKFRAILNTRKLFFDLLHDLA